MDASRHEMLVEELQAEIGTLRAKVAELQGAFSAVSAGEVDAVLLPCETGTQVFTRQGDEYVYRAMVEAMNEGAAILIDSNIVYCNVHFAEMLNVPLERVIGKSLFHFVHENEHGNLSAILTSATSGSNRHEVAFCDPGGKSFHLQISLKMFEIEGMFGLCMVATNLSERVLTQLQLATTVYQACSEAMVVTETEYDNIISVNPAFSVITGYSQEEVMGRNCRFLQGQERDQPGLAEIRSCLKEGRAGKAILRNYKKDGTLFWNSINISPILDKEGKVTQFLAIIEDITESKQAEAEILRFKNILDNTLDMVFIFESESLRFIYLNHGAVLNMGYSREELLGMTPYQIKPLLPESQFRQLIAPLLSGEQTSLRFETVNRRKDGTDFPVDVVFQLMMNSDGKRFFVAIMRDITERKQFDVRILHQATHDTLTDLPNRFALEQFTLKEIVRSQRNQSLLALGMIDLDRFKFVNDTYGHEAGDTLLRELARRFKSLMRETDFIARFGGDEFVVVIENLDEDQVVTQLSRALDRLHSAVEQPFEVLLGTLVTVDMTMGLALYPRHGTDAGSLMREADAAMYQAKNRKLQRDSWWQLGTQSQDEPLQEQEMDAFSLEAAEFLRKAQPLLESILVRFVDTFYHHLANETGLTEILATLSSADMQRLKLQQADHLRFLLNPMTPRAEVMNRGQHLGRLHMLIGVTSGMFVQSYALYRLVLSQSLGLEPMASRIRYRLTRLIEERMQIDLQAQLKSGAHVVEIYQSISNYDLPLPGALWADVIKEEMARLGHLPGIAGVILMRLDSRGIFIVEHSAGPKADAISQMLQSPETAILIDPSSPNGQGVGARAWRSNKIQSLASCNADSRHAVWQEAAHSIGLRSAMAIPVNDMLGHVVTLLVFYGAYPHQFETSWMRQFAFGLQKHWGDMWERTRGQATTLVISQDEAHILRNRLFVGGLSMFMQPIVDLKNGQALKVEALARLIMPDGQVISPGVFLPLLGDSELDQVFRQGLDQTLAWLNRWDVAGLNLTVSINLPPSTLFDPECPRWVTDSLTRHGIAPERLYLELLETVDFNADRQNIAIEQLRQQGVKFSMDDLGSGYSSLKRLSTLPFDMIKVDQSLLKELYIHPLETLGLITTIINLGRYYRHDVTVEGLEDAGMFEVAAILGAQFGQGYTIRRPMPAEAVVDWIRDTVITPYTGHIQTFIGALAYHHRILMDNRQNQLDIKTCPVRHFLIERGLQNTDAYRWHVEFHSGHDEAGKMLLDWLAEQVGVAVENG